MDQTNWVYSNENQRKIYLNCTCQFTPYNSYIVKMILFFSYLILPSWAYISSFGDVTITGEGFQILTYTRHYDHWAVMVLQCATPTVTRDIQLLWSYTTTPVAYRLAWSCHYLFKRLRSVAAGIRTPNVTHARRTI